MKSDYFAVIHDQLEPSDELLAHTIFEAVVWHGKGSKQTQKPLLHTFAVIWDIGSRKDLVMQWIERLYWRGALSSFDILYLKGGDLVGVVPADWSPENDVAGGLALEKNLIQAALSVPALKATELTVRELGDSARNAVAKFPAARLQTIRDRFGLGSRELDLLNYTLED